MVEAGTSEKVEDLLNSHVKLLELVGEMRDYVANVRGIHDKATTKALMFLGGGIQAASDLTTLIDGASHTVVLNDYMMKLPADAAQAIERKRDKWSSSRQRKRALLALARELPDNKTVQDLARPFISYSGELRTDGVVLK